MDKSAKALNIPTLRKAQTSELQSKADFPKSLFVPSSQIMIPQSLKAKPTEITLKLDLLTSSSKASEVEEDESITEEDIEYLREKLRVKKSKAEHVDNKGINFQRLLNLRPVQPPLDAEDEESFVNILKLPGHLFRPKNEN